MSGKCSQWKSCNSYKEIGCSGCGFQHLDSVDTNNNPAIIFLKNEYFKQCSNSRKGTGGRIAIDSPFRNLIVTQANSIVPGFPNLRLVNHSELQTTISVSGEEINFKLKCDAAFKYRDRYIFCEIKGYGDDTNSVLSAIMASQLIDLSTKFKKHLFLYLGVSSGLQSVRSGLSRKNFLNKTRTQIAPYVYWAESKNLIKFYGILDIVVLLNKIKEFCLD